MEYILLISTGQQVLLGRITWLATWIKTGVVHCKYRLKQFPYSGGNFFLQKIASAAHPIKVDKCGGEIAKLATSSH